MNTENENDIDLIEKYFDKELSDPEVAVFNDRLETDGELKKLFEQEKAIMQGIRYEGLVRDLNMLKDLEKRIQPVVPAAKTVFFKPLYLKIAAAIIVVAVAAKMILPVNEDPAKLFNEHFKPYPNAFEPKNRGTNDLSKRAEAFEAYEQKNYRKALEGFNEILKEGNDPAVLLLAGNSNLMVGNVKEAENNFLTLIKDYDALDTQAKWYLSLCYLKEGNVDQARTMWEELSGTEISYANKAKDLLKKVN